MENRSGKKFVFVAVVVSAASAILMPMSCASPEAIDLPAVEDAGPGDVKPDITDAKPDKATGGSGGNAGQGGGGSNTGGKGGAAGSGGSAGKGGSSGSSGKGGASGTGGEAGTSGTSGTSGSSGSPMYAAPPGESEQECGPGRVFIFGTCFP